MLMLEIMALTDVSNFCQENEDLVIEQFRKQGYISKYQRLHMVTTAGPDAAW